MQLGYVRVSTTDQTLALQLDAMRNAGIERVFEDTGVSGTIDPVKRRASRLYSRTRDRAMRSSRGGSIA